MIKDNIIPMIGERKIKSTVTERFCISITSNRPVFANAAPIKPPIKVCDELEGMPNHQVSKFQKIAAAKPANITVKETNSG